MSDDIKIETKERPRTGSTECRRLRRQGRIPANVFGHQQAPLAVSIDAEAFRPVLLTGHKVVDLSIEGKSEKALVREVQWDTFSTAVQHVDFQRVNVTERMTVDVPVVLRGTPQGVLDGGVLNHQLHSLVVEATALNLPDQIELRVNDLKIGDSIHVSDVTNLPEGVVIKDPGDLVVVQVTAAVAMPDIVAPEEGVPAQPELIGRKPAEGEGEGA